jgi:hypothetical protein
VATQLLGQRPREHHHGLEARHARAAEQRVTRAIQRLIDSVRRGRGRRCGQEVADDLEMATQLFHENVGEHGIHRGLGRRGRLCLHAQRLARDARRIGVAFREGLRTLHQQLHVDLRSQADLELLEKLRQRAARLLHKPDHRRRRLERLVDDSIEQILDIPSELAEQLGADHASAALQRVEGAARRDQRLGIFAVSGPQRQVARDVRDFLLGLLDENLDELGIGASLLDLHHARRRSRCFRGDWRRRRCRRGGRRGALRDRQLLEQVEAALGVLEHVPWITAPAAHGLHVVLDAHDRVREALQVFGPQLRAGGEPRADDRGDAVDDGDGLRLPEHQQAGRNTAQLRLGRLQRAQIRGIVDERDYGFLDLG